MAQRNHLFARSIFSSKSELKTEVKNKLKNRFANPLGIFPAGKEYFEVKKSVEAGSWKLNFGREPELRTQQMPYEPLANREVDDENGTPLPWSPMHINWTTTEDASPLPEDWTPTDHVSVLTYFEEFVERTPAAVALVLEDGRSYSYRVLDDLANAVGEKVAAACVPAVNADDTPLVGVMVTRGVALVVGILGCLKAGAAYVPVDPAFPPDRQTYIFDQAQCHCLLTDAACLDQAIALGVQVHQLQSPTTHGEIWYQCVINVHFCVPAK